MRIGDFAVDHFIQQTTRVLRRYQQVVEADWPVRVFDKIKHATDFISDARVGGEERIVGVDTSGFLVEVAGADMRITHYLIAFFTRNEEEFGVDLQPRRREDNVYAGFCQTFGPVNIGLFVEASLQFNHHGHFFTVVGGVDHRIDNP